MCVTFDNDINFEFFESLTNESLDLNQDLIANELNCINNSSSSEETEFYELLVDWCDRQLGKKRKLTDYNEADIEQFGGSNFFEIQQRSEKINNKFNTIQIAYKLIFKN